MLQNAAKSSMEREFLDACENLAKRIRTPAQPKANAAPDELDLPLPDDVDERKLYNAYLRCKRLPRLQHGSHAMGKFMPADFGYMHLHHYLNLTSKPMHETMDDEEASDSEDDDLEDEAFNADAEEEKAEQKQSNHEMETDKTWSWDDEVAKDNAKKRKRIPYSLCQSKGTAQCQCQVQGNWPQRWQVQAQCIT